MPVRPPSTASTPAARALTTALALTLALALGACPDDPAATTDTAGSADAADAADSGDAADATAPDTADLGDAADTADSADATPDAADTADAADAADTADVPLPAAVITALRIEPPVIHPRSPIEAVFAVDHAASCALESSLFDAPRPIGAAALADGHLDFSVSQAELDAAGPGWKKLTLRCASATAGGPDAEASIYAAAALGPGIAIAVEPALLPAEGGPVDICWSASNAAFCAVFAPGFAQEELTAEGCVEDVAMSADAVSLVTVQCGDGLVDGTGNIVAEPALVVAGTGVRAFEANPMVLGEPGSTHVTWEVGGVEGCTVKAGDRVVTTGSEGAVDVAVASETELVLTCTAGDRVLEERRIVSVGAAILGAGFPFEGGNDFIWEVLADVCRLDVRNDTFWFTLDGLPTTGKGTGLPLPIPTLTRAEGLVVTLTCTADDGRYTATRVVTLPARPAITEVTFDPPGLPPGGGLVTACWDAARADVCEVYLNGSGDTAGFYASNDCATFSAADWFHFRLECYGGPIEPAVYETDLPVGRWVGLRASPSALASAGPTTLTWQSAGVAGCALIAGGALVAAVDPSGTREVAVTDDTDFLLRCAADGAIVDAPASVRVGAGIDAFDAVAVGQGARVSWATSLVDGCDLTVASAAGGYVVHGGPASQEAPASGGGGPRPPKGSTGGLVLPFDRAADATLTLACQGPGGAYTQSVVIPAAEVLAITSMIVTPEELPDLGADVDVCITTTGADACVAGFVSLETGMGRALAFPAGVPTEFTSGNGCLSRSTASSLFFDEATEVTVRCVGVRGDVERRAVIGAGPSVVALSAEPPALAAPGTVAVSWSSLSATRCELTRDGDVVAEGTTGDAVAVALTATSELTVTCTDGDRSGSRTLAVPVGAELTASARSNGAYQLVVSIGGYGLASCEVVATNAGTTVGSGPQYGREPAPVSGDFYLDWSFGDLGAAAVTVACLDLGGGPHTFATTVAAPVAPLITSFTAPEALEEPGTAAVCFAAENATSCSITIGSLGQETFTGAAGCWGDDGRDAASFQGPDWVSLDCVGADGVWSSRFQSVLVGPTIIDFALDGALVPAGGQVAVTWSTYAMQGCDLRLGAEVASQLDSGELTLEPAANTTVLLTCVGVDGQTYERQLAVEVGRQIASFRPYAADTATVVVEWRALFVDDCSIDVETVGGVVRAHLVDQPPEGAVVVTWDFAADGPAAVMLRCHAAGQPTLVAEARVAVPQAVAIDLLRPSTNALAAPGAVDVCWAASGTIGGCALDVAPADPIRATSPFFSTGVPASGCLADALAPDGLALAESSVVALTCWGPVNVARAARAVTVGPDIGDLYAAPSSLAGPGTTTLTWTSGGLSGCSLRDAAGQELSTASDGELAVTLQASTLFTLRCLGPDGEVVRRLGVGVGPSAFIELARPIDASSIVVSWRGEGAVDCTLTITGAAWSQRFDLWPVGTQTFYTPFAEQGDLDLDLVCHAATDAGASATIASPLPSIARFDATPAALAGPGTTTLCWSALAVDGCDLALGEVASPGLAAEGCLDVEVALPTTATLTCPSPVGVATRALPIALGPTILDFAADFTELPSGGYFTTLTWSSVLTTGCTLADDVGTIATGDSGTARPFVSHDTTFTLTCGTGPSALVQTLAVTVAR